MTSAQRDLLELAPTPAPSVERIILGGRFGEEPVELSWQRLDRFVEAGGRFVDTAHCYAGGDSERVIGEWLWANPGGVIISDKIGHPDDDDHLDLSASNLTAEAAESRQRLGVEKIDMLLLHRDSVDVPIEEIADILVGLVDDGFAERIGVSNWASDRLERLADALAAREQVPVVSYQRNLAEPETPLWPGSRHADVAVLEVIERRNLPLLAWAAQARGFFAGSTELPGPGQADPFDTNENRARRRRCQEFAAGFGIRPETVALAWLLHQPGTWSIVGPQTISELNTSLAAAELQLDGQTLNWMLDGER